MNRNDQMSQNGVERRLKTGAPQQSEPWAGALYRVLARVLYLGAGLVLVFWFSEAISLVILFTMLALIVAFTLNPSVTWLERRHVPRSVGTTVVCLGVAVVAAVVGWLVVPRLIDEAAALAADLPNYAAALSRKVSAWFAGYPRLQQHLTLTPQAVDRLLP